MLSEEAESIYISFIIQVVSFRAAWTLRCHGDLVLLSGADTAFFPLWPDRESAEFFRAKQWPSFEPASIPLKSLLGLHLRSLARDGHLVGIGLAPHPDVVVLRANHIRRDLLTAKRDTRLRVHWDA